MEEARRHDCGPHGPTGGAASGLLERCMSLISLNAEVTENVFFERWRLLQLLVEDLTGPL